jgi:hypothetical protein
MRVSKSVGYLKMHLARTFQPRQTSLIGGTNVRELTPVGCWC